MRPLKRNNEQGISNLFIIHLPINPVRGSGEKTKIVNQSEIRKETFINETKMFHNKENIQNLGIAQNFPCAPETIKGK